MNTIVQIEELRDTACSVAILASATVQDAANVLDHFGAGPRAEEAASKAAHMVRSAVMFDKAAAKLRNGWVRHAHVGFHGENWPVELDQTHHLVRETEQEARYLASAISKARSASNADEEESACYMEMESEIGSMSRHIRRTAVPRFRPIDQSTAPYYGLEQIARDTSRGCWLPLHP